MIQPTETHTNILIVDDNPDSLTILSQMLTDQGYSVRPAINGHVALKAIQKAPPDVILLDIMMPDLDGYEVCRQLKSDERTRDIPVIFISALGETLDKVKAFHVGGVDYITKPFQVEEVVARVHTHVNLQRTQKQLQEQNAQLQQEILDRKQAEEALEHRNSELSLLARLSQTFSSSLKLDDVLNTALEEIQRLLDTFSLSFWLIAPERNELVCMQAKGPGSANLVHWRLALGQGITGWAVQHGKSVLAPDTWADARHLRDLDEQTGVIVRSMMVIPLRVKGDVIGVLNLVDPRAGHFTHNDLIFLEPIAATAATAIENARLYTTAQQEIAERKQAEQVQAALYRISEAAQTAQHLDTLFPAIRDILSQLIPVENFYIAFYNAVTEAISYPYCVDHNIPVRRAARKFGNGLAEHVLRTGQPLLFNPEVREALIKRGELKPVAFEPTVIDWLGVPLKASDKIIGLLVVKSYSKEVRFGVTAQQMLMVMSTQIALAIEHKQAEDLLRKLKKAVETTEVGVTITDNDGYIVYINPADARMHRYLVDELIGKPASIFSPPELREPRADSGRQFETLPNWKRERPNLRKDGSVFPVMLISNPIADEQGSRIGMVTVCEDTTERKRAEKLLQESEKRYRSIFENAPTGIFQATLDGHLITANPALARMLGYTSVRELLEHVTNVAEQVYVEPRHWYDLTDMIRAIPEVAKVESRCRYKDGGEMIISLNIWSVQNEQGMAQYFEGFMEDITERKQMEQTLIAANSELTKTLEYLKLTQAQLVQSEKMAALGQLIAGIAHEINTPLGAIRSSIGTIANTLNQTLEQLPAFLRALSEDRQQDFFALLHRSRQKDVTLSVKEEREFKRTLVKIVQAHNLDDARRMAETLVNIGIYDQIEPFLPLLQDPDHTQILNMAYQIAGLQESTRTILTATDRASKVVFALKTYARHDYSGKMVAADVIEGLETVLTLYYNQLKHGVEVVRRYEKLPPIPCYPDELNQVWTNLIHNALQAMEYKGTLTVEVHLSPPFHPSLIPSPIEEGWREVGEGGREGPGEVVVSVTDTGKGIPEGIQEKIFEPFFTTKPAGEGSGLGLDICKKIIDKHQGRIEVESQPGRTTFSVWLPVLSKHEE